MASGKRALKALFEGLGDTIAGTGKDYADSKSDIMGKLTMMKIADIMRQSDPAYKQRVELNQKSLDEPGFYDKEKFRQDYDTSQQAIKDKASRDLITFRSQTAGEAPPTFNQFLTQWRVMKSGNKGWIDKTFGGTFKSPEAEMAEAREAYNRTYGQAAQPAPVAQDPQVAVAAGRVQELRSQGKSDEEIAQVIDTEFPGLVK